MLIAKEVEVGESHLRYIVDTDAERVNGLKALDIVRDGGCVYEPDYYDDCVLSHFIVHRAERGWGFFYVRLYRENGDITTINCDKDMFWKTKDKKIWIPVTVIDVNEEVLVKERLHVFKYKGKNYLTGEGKLVAL